MSNALATQDNQSIFARFAARFGLDSAKVSNILKNTAFKVVDRNGTKREATDEQMAALLVVADQFNLNPFVKEIYAFPDSNGQGIVPIVPIDGWTRIANEHPQYDGVEFSYAEDIVTFNNKKCPAWIEATVFRKDRSRPTTVREYMEECARETNSWKSHPRRMLRHKAFMQCCRVAFSFGGVYDEDEGERIASARIADLSNAMPLPLDVTPPTPALPPGEAFDAFIAQTAFADQREKVDAYLTVCTHHFGSSVDDVKAEICRRPEDFLKTYPAWLKSVEQQKQTPSHVEKTPSKGREKPTASPVDKPQDQATESKEIECAVFGTIVRTGVECLKCERREKDCGYWLSPGEAEQSEMEKG